MAAIAAIVAIVPACSKKPTEPKTASVAPAAAPTTAAAAAEDDKPHGTTLVHGVRKLRNLDAPVFVDGKQKAVLRFGELPPQIHPIFKATDEIREARYYRISDYLTAVGVDVSKVVRVDIAGMRDKIAGITGPELRADKDRFVFDFQEKAGGAAKVNYDTTALANTLRIFDIYAINVFVRTKPWAVDPTLHCYREDDDCKPVARFTDDDLMKGTRVYADGKLVSYVKRRLLADGLTTGTKTGDGEAEFSMDKYLASVGVDASKAKRVELLSGDFVVAAADAAAWAKDKGDLTFALVRHSHGKVTARIPADLQAPSDDAAPRDVQVTAIEVFDKIEPRPAKLVAIDDVPDVSPLVESGQREEATAQLGTDGEHERDRKE
jgi:hypothetical protein